MMLEIVKFVWSVLSIILQLNLIFFLIYGLFIKFYGKEIKLIEKFIQYIGSKEKLMILYILSLIVAVFITIFRI